MTVITFVLKLIIGLLVLLAGLVVLAVINHFPDISLAIILGAIGLACLWMAYLIGDAFIGGDDCDRHGN